MKLTLVKGRPVQVGICVECGNAGKSGRWICQTCEDRLVEADAFHRDGLTHVLGDILWTPYVEVRA